MNKNIVSFETAKLLKAKGFNKMTKACYNHLGILYKDRKNNEFNNLFAIYSAPKLHKAQKWLRNRCDIHISIDWGMDGYNFALVIKDVDGSFIETSYHDYYPTYEECLDEGIKSALKTLQDGKK